MELIDGPEKLQWAIDVHCHLDLFKAPRAVIAECVLRNVRVLSVTTVPSAFHGTRLLAARAPFIETALGLHPEIAVEREQELDLFERLLPSVRFVGEVGIDGSEAARSTLSGQVRIFNDILEMCSRAGGRTLSIHSRGALDAVLDSLEAHPGCGVPILHWVSGTNKQISRAIELDCWFSVGPSMAQFKSGRAVLAQLPQARILPESDAPFAKVSGKPIFPWDSWSIVGVLADTWGMPVEEGGAILRRNFHALRICAGQGERSGSAP